MLKQAGAALGAALLGSCRDLAPIVAVIAPKVIVPLAYDSGGVTTSTVTVPLVAALGLGIASNAPGRSPALDGFGLIAFASLFPIIDIRTEVVLFLVSEDGVAPVPPAIYNAGQFHEPSTGIAFVRGVESAIDIESQMTREQ